MIVGCYDLHLYCDHGNDEPGMSDEGKPYREKAHGYDEMPHQFSGPTEADCKRQARKRGWRFARDGRCFCRKHA